MNTHNINRSIKIVATLATLALAFPAFGQEASVSGNASVNTGGLSTVRKEIHQDRADLRQDIKKERGDLRDGAKEEREAMHRDIKENKQEFRDAAKDLRGTASGTAEIRIKRGEMRNENHDLRASTTEDIRAKRDVMKEDIKNQIANFKEGKKVKLDDAKKSEVKTRLQGVFQKLNTNLAKIVSFNTKISARIALDKTKGIDVTLAESALIEAQVALGDATTAVNAINSGLTETITTADKISKEVIQTNVKKAQGAIKNAREKYRAVLKIIIPTTDIETNTSSTVETEQAK